MANTNKTSVYSGRAGMTLIELIVCTVIIGILSATAAPLAKNAVRREKEKLLRMHVYDMRRAIDRFYEKASKEKPGLADEEYYPKSLDELVEKRMLRKIPIDPFTEKADWATRSSTDAPGSQLSNARNVFDVFSSTDKIDPKGEHYNTW